MPASKPMKLKAARYNAIATHPKPAEKNNPSDKPQAISKVEIDIQRQEFKMMMCVIEEAIKQRKEVRLLSTFSRIGYLKLYLYIKLI